MSTVGIHQFHSKDAPHRSYVKWTVLTRLGFMAHFQSSVMERDTIGREQMQYHELAFARSDVYFLGC